jgi:arylsulfatase A-like enzyme
MQRPNILWFCTDRQRADTLGVSGNSWVNTPNLNALATQGVLFDEAYCQSPICSPSRASFLTGRYPRTTGVTSNGRAIPASEKLVSRLLADTGYYCGHIGKMHLSPGDPKITQGCERRINDGYQVFEWSLHPPGPPFNAYTSWLAEKGVEFKRTPVAGSPYIDFGMPAELSNPGWVAERSRAFIRAASNQTQPWFLTAFFEAPHNPFDPPKEFLARYLKRLDEIPLPRYTPGELDNKPPFQTVDRNGVWGGYRDYYAYPAMSDRDHRMIRAAYWALCDHIDYEIGRVLDLLRTTAQLENTIVLFSSDHGEMLGDHGLYFQGAYFYREMMRVPLLMVWPGRTVPLKSKALVELTDVVPTLLEAAGIPGHPGIQGRSFWSLASGQNDPHHHRSDIYHEYYQAIPGRGAYSQTGGAYLTGVRSRDYALTAVHNLDCGEIYDLKADPGEVRNLWADPAHASIRTDRLKRLCDRMADTIDPLPLVEGAF